MVLPDRDMCGLLSKIFLAKLLKFASVEYKMPITTSATTITPIVFKRVFLIFVVFITFKFGMVIWKKRRTDLCLRLRGSGKTRQQQTSQPTLLA